MPTLFMMMPGHLGLINMVIGLIVLFLILKLIVDVIVMRSQRKEGKLSHKAYSSRENIEHYHEAGLSDSDIKIFRETLADAKENIETWEANAKKNDDLQVVESVTGGLEASKQTFKYIVKNPQELTKQNDFLYKDLPNMVKLSEKYLAMKKQAAKSDDIERDLDETLLLIKTLSKHISKNYHEVLMDDVNVIKNQVKYD